MKSMGRKQLQGVYIPQELLKELAKVNNRLLIGIPRERCEKERRLPLTPEAIGLLTDAGHHVLIETGAGLGANYSDNYFSEVGAEIVGSAAEAFQADVVLKILPPQADEVALMKPRSTLFSMMQFNLFHEDAFRGMMVKRIHAVAYELMTDEQGRLPIMSILSEIEGAAAINIASRLLSNDAGGKGVLLGGLPGIPPTEIVIIGAGIAAISAAKVALGLGATVKIFDDDINKLRTIQQVLGQKVFTSNFHPKVLHNAFHSADVVLGAMSYINVRRRYVIAEELVQTLKRGALIIDLRISQGGCFETTCGLSPKEPELFEHYGVLHYCKSNISNNVARTTSMAFSNVLYSTLMTLGDMGSLQSMIKNSPNFRCGVYMYSGKLVNNCVSNHFNMLSNNLDIYLSAFD